MHMRRSSGFFSATFRLQPQGGGANSARRCWSCCASSVWRTSKDELATSLPYGKQRRLEIARALATQPKLLLLDEPAAGMNPQETDRADRVYPRRSATDFHMTILLIEHHMNLVMDISDRIYVLDFGELIAQGVPAEIQANDRGHRRISGGGRERC